MRKLSNYWYVGYYRYLQSLYAYYSKDFCNDCTLQTKRQSLKTIINCFHSCCGNFVISFPTRMMNSIINGKCYQCANIETCSTFRDTLIFTIIHTYPKSLKSLRILQLFFTEVADREGGGKIFMCYLHRMCMI